ncbi:PREDICTED: uncharacterized protein LOC109482212 [Branchiostoma belcheri]|uniref:Uncharacterized protein LOC109482212 n=1 Tax=Branchiostoma belcheri TaxID=7741 RepID=A0A6P4ZUA8_BRABE|nr:PREDICTED: uncharacterized protein LOC109482212 [Branchiostoma belcheri]
MEKKHRDLLLAKRLEITSDLRFRDIRRRLVDSRILNGTDLDDIEIEQTREDQAKALLDILPNRGPKAFVVFKDALKHRYPHLARILKDDGQEGTSKESHVFIIHAGEDKEPFVRPLVTNMQQQGVAEKIIFFDEISIEPGEVIRERIISTLSSQSLELAVIVVSTSLLNKHYWPKLEFETCLKNNKRIFPIWVDDNSDNFKAFSELVGKYSPTLKQLSARCVQRGKVTDELPNIAAEIVRRLKGIPPEAIQGLLHLTTSPSMSDSSSSNEDQDTCTTGFNDEQQMQDKLKKEELEYLKTLNESVFEFIIKASREELMPKAKIAELTESTILNYRESGMKFIKIERGCVIIHLIPNSRIALDRFWRKYRSGQLSKDFSQYLITDEMRTVVGKDLFIRVIMLEEQYWQWKHYFDATDETETVKEFQSSSTTPASSVMAATFLQLPAKAEKVY